MTDKNKVALIISNSPFLTNERVFPNLGLLRVATQLQKDGHHVDVYDLAGQQAEMITRIPNDYTHYGFSATTPQMPYVMNLLRLLKSVNPKAKTIIGGPHPSAVYQLRRKGKTDININDLETFDTIFAGEGEETSNIFKPGWQKGDLIKDIDTLPMPNRDLIDLLSYTYNLNGRRTTSVHTQRGCPYQCSFCSGRDVEMYNKIRNHSPERVLQEMDEIHAKYGFDSFMWYDDEINLNMGRLEELCSYLSQRPYQHRGFIRSDAIVKHPESIEWMKKAGFVKLCAGVESGSDRMLKSVDKKCTAKMNSDAREIIRRAGIHYEAFMLLGFPGEEVADVVQTYFWIKDNKPDDFDLNLITPYPGSKMYDDAEPSTKFPEYKWEYNGLYFNKPRYSIEDSFYKGKDMQSHSDIRTDTITNLHYKIVRDEIDAELRSNLPQWRSQKK